MSWALWICKLWCLLRPGETLLNVFLDVRIYNPDIPVPSHLYDLAVGLVRDEAEIPASM